jgi:Rad3-related DNA helicase
MTPLSVRDDTPADSAPPPGAEPPQSADAEIDVSTDAGAGAGSEPVLYTVSVRNLCAFAAKSGDLDLRFTPSPTAQQGRQGHQLVAQRRGPQHEAEVSLDGRFGPLRVRGRADGFDPRSRTLEEVKTYRGTLENLSAQQQALHWAQLKVYGWLMCESRALPALTLSLVYFDVALQTESPQQQRFDAETLRAFFESLCLPFLAWAREEVAHRARRDAALAQRAFPQLPFRAGQRALAAAVYKACLSAQPLLAQAPTGIGKTIATVYPALRAMPERGSDKLFFLTAKTPGRQVALDALHRIRDRSHQGAGDLPLRVIELVAKDKACEHRDKACHGASCPLAQGFYERLPAARAAAAQAQWLDRPALRAVALAHGVCPYYLGHEMVRWSDVVVGDYNYYFDRSAMLHTLTAENGWRVTLLVDEAHNLVPRACAMYSADLGHAETLALRTQLPGVLRGRLDALLDQWQLLQEHLPAAGAAPDWQLLEAPPEAWLRVLHRLNQALGEHVNSTALGGDDAALPFYFRTLAVAALADGFADHSLCEYTREPPVAAAPAEPAARAQVQLAGAGFDSPDASGRITLRNVVPGHFLAARWASADAIVLFSATLQPPDYYQALLGLPAHTRHLDLPSPFRAEQLDVRVVPVSTRRDLRAHSLDTLADTMAAQYRARRGNYLAFFSSFDYMEQSAARLRQRCPEIALWLQARQMDEAARRDFLDQFGHAGAGIGFAVLGGVFGEGVDLPGARLIGAFIATLGLPQFDPVNEAIRARMQACFGQGYDYTYVYPGLQKVVQAAGRVIRSETDTGCVVLLDARYREPRYRALLPSWWQIGAQREAEPAAPC